MSTVCYRQAELDLRQAKPGVAGLDGGDLTSDAGMLAQFGSPSWSCSANASSAWPRAMRMSTTP
ncbi:MAG TPA: hypothetical protein PLQ54_21485, partial [Armatimonadota bacterium]|nr:hypothetical protein [Armatimonadota bacterium]